MKRGFRIGNVYSKIMELEEKVKQLKKQIKNLREENLSLNKNLTNDIDFDRDQGQKFEKGNMIAKKNER